MANTGFFAVQAKRSDIKIEHGQLVGAAAASATVESGGYGPFITAAVWSATGTYALTFARTYPALKGFSLEFVGATAGLQARFTAIDVAAGTAALLTEVAGTATDMAATDTLYLTFYLRNSGANG